jgi:hypothetical protein
VEATRIHPHRYSILRNQITCIIHKNSHFKSLALDPIITMLFNAYTVLAGLATVAIAKPVAPGTAADISPRDGDIAALYGIDVSKATVVDLRSDEDKKKRQNPGHVWACDNIGFVEPCINLVVQNGQWFNIEGLSLNNRISSIGANWGASCWAWEYVVSNPSQVHYIILPRLTALLSLHSHFNANGCWNDNGTPALDITYPGLRDMQSFGWNDKIGCIKCDFWA